MFRDGAFGDTSENVVNGFREPTLLQGSQWPSNKNEMKHSDGEFIFLSPPEDGKFCRSLLQVTFLKVMAYERRPLNNVFNMSFKWPSEIVLISNSTRLSKKSACKAKSFRT